MTGDAGAGETGACDGLNWLAMGDGPGLAFIHGAGGNAASWRAQMEAFAPERRCVAYDLRGFGRSTPLDPTRLPGSLAQDAVAVMDAAGLGATTLVCQSLGGWTGLRTALEAPERVERLVLCCTMAGVAHPPAIETVMGALAKAGDRGPAALALPERFRAANPAAAYLYDQITAFSPPLDMEMAAQLFSPEVLVPTAELARIEIPVLVLAGELDTLWPPAVLEPIAAAFPNGAFEVVSGVGHSIYFEQPETFNRILQDFLIA